MLKGMMTLAVASLGMLSSCAEKDPRKMTDQELLEANARARDAFQIPTDVDTARMHDLEVQMKELGKTIQKTCDSVSSPIIGPMME